MSGNGSAIREKLSPRVGEMCADLVATRRAIHRHPERGFQEHRTAERIAKHLEVTGLAVTTGVAQTGVVGLLEGGRPGKTLLVRADMDALPLTEANDVEYRSEIDGVMHACGHDAHVSIALAAARVLAAERDDLKGNIKFVFQPAEEGPGGALPMIEEGVLEGPTVDAAVGLHVWNDLPTGVIGVRKGPLLAAADRLEIFIEGRGGHGAAPHHTVDLVVVASHVIQALQTVVSRQIDPLHPVVVSICSMHGGRAFNIIPGEVNLLGTVRSFDPKVREEMPARIERLVLGVARAFGAEARIDYQFGYPSTVNDDEMSELVGQCSDRVPAVVDVVEPDRTLGGEDMAYFQKKVPGCFFFLGTRNEERGLDSPHHSPTFDIDEEALPVGVEVFCEVARSYLR